MTPRGRFALGLGVVTYVVAWAFGSRSLYPVAVGLLLAVALAWGWVHFANRPMRLRRFTADREHLEDEDVEVELDLCLEGPLTPAAIVVVERLAKLGERTTALHRDGRRLHARYHLTTVPRGRYVVEEAHAVLEDPFGLQRIEVPLDGGGALLVYPRLVELDRLFTESGAHAHDGRRLLLRRPSGFDLHSVREYEHGESLRKVHWRSTARRGQLMVKELEDAPRDEVAVLLDAQAGAVAGGSFDVQVRAAGSILRSHARRGRRGVLIVHAAVRETQRVHSFDGDWRLALELLAAAEPTGKGSVAALLNEEGGAATRALELTVVTASLSAQLVERLVQRALARRSCSVVYVDAPSFAGRRSEPEPGLLRLQASGVPVAVLRDGDDLAEKLGAEPLAGAAHG